MNPINVTYYTFTYIKEIEEGDRYKDNCLYFFRDKLDELLIPFPEDYAHRQILDFYISKLIVEDKSSNISFLSLSSLVLSKLRLLHVQNIINLNIKIYDGEEHEFYDVSVDEDGVLSNWEYGFFSEEHNIIQSMRRFLKEKHKENEVSREKELSTSS